MQAVALNMMFTILSGYVGQEVSCVSNEFGEDIEYRGILKEVLPFNGVQIDNHFVYFDIKDCYIREIVSLVDQKSAYINLDKVGNNFEPEDRRPKL